MARTTCFVTLILKDIGRATPFSMKKELVYARTFWTYYPTKSTTGFSAIEKGDLPNANTRLHEGLELGVIYPRVDDHFSVECYLSRSLKIVQYTFEGLVLDLSRQVFPEFCPCWIILSVQDSFLYHQYRVQLRLMKRLTNHFHLQAPSKQYHRTRT